MYSYSMDYNIYEAWLADEQQEASDGHLVEKFDRGLSWLRVNTQN